MSLAVIDIDGVVADVRHRLHFLNRRPKDWDGFFAAAAADPALDAGVILVHDLAARHDVVWLSGRPVSLTASTQDWLRAQGLPGDEVHLRAARDRRPARVYKLEVLRTLAAREVGAFVDDDDDVVRAALAAGFPAVLADWLPRDPALRAAQDRSGRS